MNKKHVVKLAQRSCVCEISEQRKRVVFKFHFTRLGQLNDDVDLAIWLSTIFDQYKSDPREIKIENRLTGDAAFVAGKGKLQLAVWLFARGDDWKNVVTESHS